MRPLTLERQVLHLEAFVRATVAGHNRGIGDQGVVDTRERNQISLEFGQVDVEGTIETKTGSDGADDLGDQTVQVLIAGTGDVQVAAADIVDSLVVDQERAVGILNGAVSRQNRVVWLHDGVGHTGRRVNGELEFGLLAILGGKTFEQQSTESRSSTTAERVEDHETLQGSAVVYQD